MRFMFKLLTTSTNVDHCQMVSKLIGDLLVLYPPAKIPFEWEELECLVKTLVPEFGNQANPSENFLRCQVIALTAMVETLEAEILQRSPRGQRHMNRSETHTWISADYHGRHIRDVSRWLVPAVAVGTGITRLVLPLLQRLVQLSIAATDNPDRTVDRVANYLLEIFDRINKKSLLMSTIISPFLRYKFASRVLSRANSNLSSPVSVNLRDIVEHFFTMPALPSALVVDTTFFF